MRRISFRLLIAILTFCVGVAVATTWFISRHNQSAERNSGEQSQPQEADAPAIFTITPEEYAVYSVVLNDLLRSGDRFRSYAVEEQYAKKVE